MEGDEQMDDGMEGDADAPVIGMDDQEDEEEEEKKDDADRDFSSDPRIQWMLRGLSELTNYRADEPETAPTNERLSQFFAFLERSDYSRFFVWVDFDNPELRWSFERAPHYYEASKYSHLKKFKF